MSQVKCAFNDNFEQFAAITNDNRIKIWDTQTNKLKTQIVPSSHLSSSYTCLRWAPSIKLNGVTQYTIALGTNQGEIYCWNINQGEPIFAIKPEDSFVGKQINDICFTKDGNSFFSCGDSSTILQFDLKSNILARFKGDKSSVSRITISEDGLYLISAGSVFIKVWEISSGRLISKFSAHRTSINNLLFTPDQKQIILSSLDQRIINLWSFNEEENSTNEIIQTFSAHNPPSFLTLNRNLNKISELHLLAVLGKKISVWNYNDSFRQNKPISDSFSISLPQNEQADRETFFLSAVFLDKDSILLARGSLVKPKFDKVKYVEKGKIGQSKVLNTPCTGSFLADTQDQITKAANGSGGVIMLSTPDINKLSATRKDTKNPKFKRDTLEPTLEEKLEQLEQLDQNHSSKSLHLNSKKAESPKLASIHSTLVQALQTNDMGLLSSCLNNRNEKLISNTIKNLPNNFVVPLLQTLIERFHSKPKSVINLVPWIHFTLVHHTSYLMTIPQFGENSLSSLYQTIDSRLSIFGPLLKLSGRLDVILAQINQRDEFLEENPALSLNEDEISDEDDDEDDEESDDENGDDDDEDDEDDEDNFVDDYENMEDN